MKETLPTPAAERSPRTGPSASMKFAHALTALALFTASFDIFLVVDIGGTIRFAQVMLLGVIGCAIARLVTHGTILWPRGGYALALWTLCQGLLLSQSPAIYPSAGMYLLLVFTLTAVFAMLQIYGLSSMVETLMRTYLFSFVFIACFGLFQFVVPILHLGSPFVSEWVIEGIVPRINGFNYEPSYFATYLIVGWIMLIDLRASGAALVEGRRWFWFLILVSAALFLSTSKTGWMMMIAEGLARLIPAVLRSSRKQFHRFEEGNWTVDLARARVVATGALMVILAFAGIAALSRFINLNTFIQGTGLNGTAAHSFYGRLVVFDATVKMIQQHFWVGRSLGGVPATIAQFYGVQATTTSDLKKYWGFPVPLDVFAASGFWVFLLFLWFFLSITVGERKLIRASWQDDRAKWLQALIRALAFEWLALCADQNLLRVYLWTHVAMVVVVGYNLRFRPAHQHAFPALVTA